jgi:hypothetical protein
VPFRSLALTVTAPAASVCPFRLALRVAVICILPGWSGRLTAGQGAGLRRQRRRAGQGAVLLKHACGHVHRAVSQQAAVVTQGLLRRDVRIAFRAQRAPLRQGSGA